MSAPPRRAIASSTPATVQAYMRHAHYSTTQRYLHHKPRPEHAQALEDAFREAVAPFSVPARDTSLLMARRRRADWLYTGLSGEAPTGIEPVYTALQAAA